jgi:hypothetical protein
MTEILNIEMLARLIVALVFGGLATIVLLVGPSAFRALPPKIAGEFMRELLPRAAVLMGALCLAAAWILRYQLESVILAIVGVVFLLVRGLLYPRMQKLDQLREAENPQAAREFRVLHGVSMSVAVAQLLAMAFTFVWLVKPY